tara:strand:+ start:1765 stop:1986 length:222 start_codon:yes stop_codon:yes gene_type:complete
LSLVQNKEILTLQGALAPFFLNKVGFIVFFLHTSITMNIATRSLDQEILLKKLSRTAAFAPCSTPTRRRRRSI